MLKCKIMNYSELPRGYKRILKIDLENDKLGTVFVSSLSCFIMLLMILFGIVICGKEYMRQYIFVNTLSEFYKTAYLLFISLTGLFVYEFFKELVRAAVIRSLCKDAGIKFNSKLLYFYIASSGYFSKKSYFIISYLPSLIFGAILIILCFIVPEAYFISVYLILILNVSGIAGDIYVSYFVSRFDKNLLIRYTGKAVYFYSKI